MVKSDPLELKKFLSWKVLISCVALRFETFLINLPWFVFLAGLSIWAIGEMGDALFLF
jgi:hypothetical protein